MLRSSVQTLQRSVQTLMPIVQTLASIVRIGSPLEQIPASAQDDIRLRWFYDRATTSLAPHPASRNGNPRRRRQRACQSPEELLPFVVRLYAHPLITAVRPRIDSWVE